jgi:hypothetical protein
MFKTYFTIFFTLSCFFKVYGAGLLPSPFNPANEPRVGSSCKSCSNKSNSEQPIININGGASLTINLTSFTPVNHNLLIVKLGTKLPYCPTEMYQLLPPGTKGGDKDSLIVVLGSKYIGFKSDVSKIGNVKFYSVNYPGYSIHRENENLVLTANKKSLQYIFSSSDGGFLWKIATIRDNKFHAKQIKCEYDDNGQMNTIIYPGNVRFTIEYKQGLPVKVTDPESAVTEIE